MKKCGRAAFQWPWQRANRFGDVVLQTRPHIAHLRSISSIIYNYIHSCIVSAILPLALFVLINVV